MDGNFQKVPQVFPSNLPHYHLGRFLSHAYVMTGYFPMCLSFVCAKVLLCSKEAVTDDDLTSSFNKFIDSFESEALGLCMSKQNDNLFKSVIIPMFSRFQVFSNPVPSKLPELVLTTARYCFIAKPYFALSEIRRGMLDSHPGLWSRCTNPCLVEAMYEVLTPTIPRVWNLIQEPNFFSVNQEVAFDYLRRFVHSLSSDLLVKFLCFVTGFSVCASEKMRIQFNSMEGFSRRPTSNTCSMVLHLPTSFQSYQTFSDEFKLILGSSEMWFFDAM